MWITFTTFYYEISCKLPMIGVEYKGDILGRRLILETRILNNHEISVACNSILEGKLVGLPTETVYGLAANGLDEKAVSEIFRVKGRPADNPLILHILGEKEWVERYCKNIPDCVWGLIEAFWPGPLTLILECKGIVPDIVTAGLITVGVRCPNHPVALKLIEGTGLPLAAPSGNLSGKPSPTTSEAMFADMKGKIPYILEGGPCGVGVESTILQVGEKVTLLRIGGISLEEIQSVLGINVEIDPVLLAKDKKMEENITPTAPGMKYRHYAPEAPVTVVIGKNSANWIAEQVTSEDGVICFQEYSHLFPQCEVQSLGKEDDFTEQAQKVFSVLRYFDETKVKRIWSQCPQESDLGFAVSHRLQKAAGFQVIRLEDL